MAAALQDIREADQVAVDVRFGVLEAVAHSRLGGEGYDSIETLGREQLRQGLAVGDIHLHEAEIGRQFSQTGMLEAHVVIVVKVVEPHYFVAPCDKGLRNVVSYESGSTGD